MQFIVLSDFSGDFTNDEAQYSALMGNAATYAKQHQLRPGIALSQAQMAQLTADIVWLVEKTITLPNGQTVKALVPQVYVRVQPGDITGEGTLIAAERVNIQLSGDLTNSGTIAGRSVMRISADNVNNLGGRLAAADNAITAKTDINNVGGVISANDRLQLNAGRDINVTTTTSSGRSVTQGGVGVYERTSLDRVAGLYVSNPGGVLVASAGRDINLTAAVVQNTGKDGSTVLDATRNLTLATVKIGESSNVTFDAKNYARFSASQELGTQVQGVGNVLLKAGQDINARAANVNSSAGATVLDAGRDVAITAGQSSQSIATASYYSGGGMLSKSSDEQRKSNASTSAVGSEIGGNTVVVNAGRDLTVKGSNVLSDQGTTLIAKRDISILADQNTQTSSSFKEVKSSGLSFDGGIAYGNQRETNKQRGNSTTAVASNVGSVGGNLTVIAGGTYTQTGSNLLTPQGDITVLAKDIKITEARQSSNSLTEQSQSKSGLSLGVSSPLLSAVQGIEAQADAASNTSSSRMKAMAAVNIALQAKQAAAAAADPTVTVSLSIGSSSSSSSQANASNTSAASTLKAGGNVNLVATGGGKDSNILVQGSQVKAGNTVNLQADNDIRLLASKDLESQTSKSTSSSASIGIGYTMGPGGAGFGVTVSASGSKGKSDGTDLAYTNTSIDGQRVNITSGGNTTLAGAVVTANKVKADIGGNLTIESLQNSSNYKSSDVSAGGSATFGFGGSVSANASSAKINSNFQSVGTQSGIRAGDGGFEVNVKGNTALTGGVISSSQAAVDKGLNSFNGNTAEGISRLTLTDISNQAEFKAQSVSISTSGGGAGSMADKSASTSQAGITGLAGNKATRTGEKEAGLVQIFDKDKVTKDIQAQVTITTAFGQNASTAIGQYAGDKAKDLKAQADNEADPAKRQALKDEAAQWGEGGIYRVGLHAAVGGLTGGANGAVGAATSQTVIPVLGEQIAQLDIPVDLKKALIQVASLSIGVATGGVQGAVAAHNATTNNYLTHADIRSRDQKIKACQATGDPACEIKVLKEYESKSAKNTGGINYKSVLTEVALKEEKALLEKVLDDPKLSPESKAQAQKSIGELNVAINVIQKSSVLRDAAELGLIIADVAMLGQLAGAKVLSSATVQQFIKAQTGKEIGEIEAARIANNFYTEGSIADPSKPMSALGAWRPAVMLSASEADTLAISSLPRGANITGRTSADAQNASAIAADFKAPFVSGSQVIEFSITQPTQYVRLYGGSSGQVGSWVMRADDIKGLSAEQIASKFGLPQVPTMVGDVTIPAGTRINASVANGISPKEAQGIYTGGNGGGGGVQFQIVDRYNNSWFSNGRALK